MSLEQLSLIAEVIGTIAIVVTLIYVSRQVKDGTRAARSAAVTDATTGMQAVYQQLGTDPQTSDLFFRALTDPDALSKQEQFQYLMFMHSFFLGFQRNFFLAQEGTLNKELRDSIGTAIVAINHLPGSHYYWRQRKSFFQPEFIAWTEELLNREPLADMEVYRGRDDGHGD